MVDCSFYFDEFWRCVTIGNQFESYYRHGLLDSCEGNMVNVYTCLKAKAQSEEAKAKAILATEIKRRPPPEPPWPLKEKPGWD